MLAERKEPSLLGRAAAQEYSPARKPRVKRFRVEQRFSAAKSVTLNGGFSR